MRRPPFAHSTSVRATFAQSIVFLLALVAKGSIAGGAQTPNRIKAAVSDAQMVPQTHNISPLLRGAVDQGRLNGALPLTSLSINFLPSATQQAALTALLQAQQNPSSAKYHKWLTPVQFGQQFGMSDSDLASVSSWLQTHGLQVESVAPSRNSIQFAGTVAQVEQTFQTELHTLSVGGEAHFANTTAPMLPSAFAQAVGSVRGLDDFRLKPHARASQLQVPYSIKGQPVAAASSVFPQPFAVSPSGTEYVAPGDFAKIYNVNALYNAGFSGGTAYPIAIIGQSAVLNADLTAFRSAFGLSATLPTMVLKPGTGASQVISTGDLSESELDLEWAGAVAKDAPVYFIYTGNAQSNGQYSYGVFDALQYAIQTYTVSGKPIPIVSLSYGQCEPSDTAANYATYENWFQQANAQGQTILAASGDQGAAACDYTTTAANGYAATQGLAVDYPASSVYVTGLGGTSFSGDLSNNATYWAPTNSSASGSSPGNLLSNELGLFIPSATWNNTATSAQAIAQKGLSAGGGGVSSLWAKPSWQRGPGVPADGKRDVPDLSLSADPNHDGFLVCINGSCAGASGFFNVYGGTSVASPSFAGMLAVTEQKLNSPQGNLNASIYTIGTNATAYASAFHDITTGTNIVPCVVAASDVGCVGGSMGYSTTPGYDLVTGLGAPDAANFTTALGNVATLSATTNTLAASSPAPSTGAAINFTTRISTGSATTPPTGNVIFTVDGAAPGTTVNVSPAGTANFSTTFTAGGPHTVASVYSGDATYYGSSSVVNLGVAPTGTVATTTTLTASPSTVAIGGSLTLSALVTAANGTLAGSVTFSSANGQIGPVIGVPLTVNGANGTAVFAYTVAVASLPVGTNTITATYGGSNAFLPSSGTASVTVTNPTITLSATNVSVNSGGSGTSTITVKSGGGYAGSVKLTASTASTLNASVGFNPATVTVTQTTPGTSTFTLTGITASAAAGTGTLPFKSGLSSIAAVSGLSFAGLLLLGIRTKGIRRKGWVSLLTVLVFTALAAGLGCSSSSSPKTGTFTVTVTGTDTASNTVTGTTNFTVTIN